MQLRHFCTARVLTVDAGDPIDAVISLFDEHDIRHVPVMRNKEIAGIVSQGDLLLQVCGLPSEQRESKADASVSHAGPMTVQEIMTEEVVMLPPQVPIIEAAQLMLDRDIGAVLITAHSKLMGIVTVRDYLGRFFDDSQLFGLRPTRNVSEAMATDVVTASPTTDLFALLRLMGGRMHHLPVLDNGKLVGMLSDHDVRRAIAWDKVLGVLEPGEQDRMMASSNAERIMHADIVSVTEDATLAQVAKLMTQHRIGSIPIVNGDQLVGIITETDILRACVEELSD